MISEHLAMPLSRRTLLQSSLAATGGAFAAAVFGRRGTVAAQTPSDAAAADKQVLRTMGPEGRYLDWSKSVQQRQFESALICEPLLRRDENYELQPAGATSWEVSSDNLTWTFHLRDGMTWTDGKPVTAADYVYTLRRMADPKTAFDVTFYYGSIKNFTEAVAGEVPIDQVGITAVDDLTVAITTAQPTPFLAQLAADIYVVPAHVVEEVGDTWSLDPKTCLSCGPFVLETWDKGKQLVFTNNPSYDGPWVSPLQQIVYKIGAYETLFPAYENDEIDLIERGYEQVISPADLARIQGDDELSKELHTWPQFQTWWLEFGGADTAFKDEKVREAFGYAVDRDAIIKSALRDLAIPAYGLLPPGLQGSNPDRLKDIQVYDPDKAKQLLSDAGYADGEGFPKYDLFLRDPSPTVQTVAQAVQAMLKENLGVDVGIQSLERKTFTERMNAHELPFILISWDMDYYDASNFMDVFVTGGRSAWSNPDYDKLVGEADSTVNDDAHRQQLYLQAEEVLVKERGAVFLWNPIFTQLWKSSITGPCLQENKYGILAWQSPRTGPQYYCSYFTDGAET